MCTTLKSSTFKNYIFLMPDILFIHTEPSLPISLRILSKKFCYIKPGVPFNVHLYNRYVR